MEVNSDGQWYVRRSTIAIVWLRSQIARIYEQFTSRLQPQRGLAHANNAW